MVAEWSSGNPLTLAELTPALYTELHALARSHMRRERAGHTLQPTALVNEAYMRLMGSGPITFDSRRHFYSIAGRVMRQILVDHSRKHLATKRGDGVTRLSIDAALVYSEDCAADFIALDVALERLAEIDERKARVVELRFFTGLSVEETAEVLETSPITVHRDLRFAMAFLAKQLKSS